MGCKVDWTDETFKTRNITEPFQSIRLQTGDRVSSGKSEYEFGSTQRVDWRKPKTSSVFCFFLYHTQVYVRKRDCRRRDKPSLSCMARLYVHFNRETYSRHYYKRGLKDVRHY